MPTSPLSILIPTSGLSIHTCGYCSPPGTRSPTPSSISYGLHTSQLSPSAYQAMLDRGWRRSGSYAYKPDMGRTCCAQYTIRLEVGGMRVGKGMRKVLRRWKGFVLEGRGEEAEGKEREEGDMDVDLTTARGEKGKGRDNAPFDLGTAIHAAEADRQPEGSKPKHTFEVILEPATYSDEKFRLFQQYQEHVHKDEEKKPSGFKRFLCDSPLIPEDIPYPSPPPPGLPKQYGSYHQKYILDGQLVALGVIDILPSCISSVYFIYSPKLEKWAMGKVSALREAQLAREMGAAGLLGMRYLYMGYYIHTCQKMKYKGDYSPSFLLDPEDYTWHPLPSCTPLLDKYRYVSFSHPPDPESGKGDERYEAVQAPIQHAVGEGEMEEDEDEGYVPLQRATAGCEDPLSVEGDKRIEEVYMVLRQRGGTVSVAPIPVTRAWGVPIIRRMLCDAVAALGWELARDVVFSLQ